jgi:hypothetical protein
MISVQNRSNTVLDSALEYHRFGWSIIPIPYGKKAARIKWGKYQKTRPDEKQLQKWFGNGNRNIAVLLGPVSRDLTCRDFDSMAEYEKWVASYPDLAKILPTVKTSKGMHIYFEAHVEGIKHIDNGELRGRGGYCLLPPSLHPEGAHYQWVNLLTNGNLLAIEPEQAGFAPHVTKRTKRIKENSCKLKEIVIEGSVNKAIIETVPSVYGTRHQRIFAFARCIKSMPQYFDAEPTQLRPLVEAWYKRALPNIRTKEFEETWIDFVLGWEKVKFLVGEEPMTKIFERAKKSEPPKIAIEKYPNNPQLQLFTTICRELQAEAGEDSFYLYCKTGARYMNVSAMSISRWFRLLELDEIVTEVEKGGLFCIEKDGSKKSVKKPSRYRYIAN